MDRPQLGAGSAELGAERLPLRVDRLHAGADRLPLGARLRLDPGGFPWERRRLAGFSGEIGGTPAILSSE